MLSLVILLVLSLLLLSNGFSFSKLPLITSSSLCNRITNNIYLNYNNDDKKLSKSLSLSSSVSSSTLSSSSSSTTTTLLSSIRQFLNNNGKRILIISIPIVMIIMFGSLPSHAAKAIKNINGKSEIVSATESISKNTTLRKIMALIKVIFDGANVKGNFRTWQAGDTRTEFAAILNSLSSIAILSFMGLIAYAKHKQREFSMNSAMKKEVKRVREYKENMYFEAVEEILGKLADPKTKGSTKASLQKQLKELDPDGIIQNYITNGGDRPDIGYILEQKPKKKKTASPPPPSSSSKSPKKKSEDKPKPKPKKIVNYEDDDEDDDEGNRNNSSRNSKEEEEKQEEEEEEEKPKPKPKSKPVDSTPKSSSNSNDILTTIMNELDESLVNVIDKSTRSKLIKYLTNRIDSISDSNKKESTLSKIAEKLGDEDYWVAYAEKIK